VTAFLEKRQMAKENEITELPDRVAADKRDSLSLSVLETDGIGSLRLETTSKKALLDAMGFAEEDSVQHILLRIVNTLAGSGDVEKRKAKGNQILSMLSELRPLDGFEGMLIAQMLAVFDRAMECFRRADTHTSCAEMYLLLQNQGIRLMRLYNQQLEALDKHRRKGSQKMTVEHVHVHKGGQAIVGNVNQGEG